MGSRAIIVCAIVVLFAGSTRSALSDETPSPAPVASPSPSPSPRATQPPGSVLWTLDAHTTFVTQGTRGPGTQPPEGPGFANGNPLGPETPYDVFSSAPLMPGNASESGLLLHGAYAGKTFDASATLGAGYVRGSLTNAAYWTESLLPTLNPHLGSQMLPYRVVFPVRAGSDDASAFAASLLSGKIASKDGNTVLRAGWFDLSQTAPFVFVQPALTSFVPAIGIALPETLGDGVVSLDAWEPAPPAYPLHGVDLVLKRGITTVELASAALPAPAGTPARMRTASVVLDHGEGTRYTAQMLDVWTAGDLITVPVLYGADPQIVPTPQGALAISVLGAQRQRVFGLSAAFHAARRLDALVELGRSTYDTDLVAQSGTGRAGAFYHTGLTHTKGRAALSLDLYRNEAYYAGAVLPYGIAENLWGASWAWPGPWLKSNYQLVDNLGASANRQGYRVRAAVNGIGSPLDVRASFSSFSQIEPTSMTNALRTGFVDAFFLPQPTALATIGRQRHVSLFAGYHPPAGDVTFEFVDDTLGRPSAPSRPQDTVAFDNPQAALTFSRAVNKRTLVSAGLARYGMRGAYGGYANVAFAERIAFAGVQFAQSPHATMLLTVRRTAFGGIPTQPAGPSPDFTGTLLLFEQRFHW